MKSAVNDASDEGSETFLHALTRTLDNEVKHLQKHFSHRLSASAVSRVLSKQCDVVRLRQQTLETEHKKKIIISPSM